VICTKVRDGDKRIVRLKEGVAKGRHVVIVDDLVQSGGTLIECQRLLTTQVPRSRPRGRGEVMHGGRMHCQPMRKTQETMTATAQQLAGPAPHADAVVILGAWTAL
jgi:hypothetical protein